LQDFQAFLANCGFKNEEKTSSKTSFCNILASWAEINKSSLPPSHCYAHAELEKGCLPAWPLSC